MINSQLRTIDSVCVFSFILAFMMHIHHLWGINYTEVFHLFLLRYLVYTILICCLWEGDLLAPSGAMNFPERGRWLHFLTLKQGVGTNKININCEKCVKLVLETNICKNTKYFSKVETLVEIQRWSKERQLKEFLFKDKPFTNSPQIIHLFISFDLI